MKRPVPITKQDVVGYALRFSVCLLTMEVILHYMYVVAIKDARAWAGDTPAQLCMLGFWNLIVVWLKVRVLASLIMCVSNAIPVAHSLAVFPLVGTRGRRRAAGEHGALYGEQLLSDGILARVAPQLQPLDHQVNSVYLGIRFAYPCLVRQIRVYSAGRRAATNSCDAGRVHVRRLMARPLVPAARMGLACKPFRPA